MTGFLQPAFIGFVLVYYVAMQVRTGLKRTTWFGALNIIAVSVLFGALPAIAILLLSCFYSWTVDRVQKREANAATTRGMRAALYTSVGLVFVWYKIWQDPAADIATSLGLSGLVSESEGDGKVLSAGGILEALAFSYVTLRIIDFIQSSAGGERVLNPLALSGFFVPFFMSPSGPINEYEVHLAMDDVEPEVPSVGPFIDSLYLIVLGYFLKFVVAYTYGLFFIGVNGNWPMNGLLDTAVFLLFVLIEFSGYSLIALGVGKLLGVPTPRNFNHPYLSTSFAEFWTRWHMSLGVFVRRTFYFPIRMALNRAIRPRPDNRVVIHAINVVALLISFAFVGLWHRFTFAFLFWGIALALVVAIETVAKEELASRFSVQLPEWLKAPLAIVYTLFMVVLTLQIAAADFAA